MDSVTDSSSGSMTVGTASRRGTARRLPDDGRMMGEA